MSRPSRAQESRAAEARPIITTDQKGRLEIDVSSLPNDLEPTWIRESFRGEYDDNNVQFAMERGFRPLDISEMPGYRTHKLPGARGSNHQDDTLIRRGGMILMVRDKRLGDQERALHAQETAETLRTVAHDTGAPKDGRNFKDVAPEYSARTERPGGRFSE